MRKKSSFIKKSEQELYDVFYFKLKLDFLNFAFFKNIDYDNCILVEKNLRKD